MPRPKRPTRLHNRTWLDGLREQTALSDDELAAFERETGRLLDDYCATWTPGARPGRNDTHRNRLITSLARHFHDRAGWTNEPGYFDYLFLYITACLLEVKATVVDAARLRRLLPADLRRSR